MRRSILAAIVFALLSGAPALAQAVIVDPSIDASDFPADRDVMVRDYVVREPAAPPVVIEEGGSIVPGGVVPDYVPLRPFSGGDPTLARFSYFVSPDNKVVVVDPKTRRVARIIAQQ